MKATLTTLLTNDEYRAQRGTSKSELDLANKSVALIEWSRNCPTDGSRSIDLGTDVHCACLEPDVFAKDYVKMPDFGSGKAAAEKAEQFKENMQGKIVLTTPEYQQVLDMRDSVLAHPVANMLLTSKGISEASIFSEMELQDGSKIKVKCRPDRIVDPEVFGQHILVDLKKTADIDKFNWSVRDFRYHVQDAYYSDIYEKYSGHKPRFVFIVVGEKRSIGRHPVRVFELDPDTKETGRKAYLQDLETVSEYQEFGCGLDVEKLDLSNIIK
jgi:hypothetical protein